MLAILVILSTQRGCLTCRFAVAILYYSYVFRLSQSNRHQAVCQKCEDEIISHEVGGRDLGLTKVITGVCMYIYIYTGCPRRNVRDFGRVFLMLNYTDITQNTYVQSRTVTEIMASEV